MGRRRQLNMPRRKWRLYSVRVISEQFDSATTRRWVLPAYCANVCYEKQSSSPSSAGFGALAVDLSRDLHTAIRVMTAGHIDYAIVVPSLVGTLLSTVGAAFIVVAYFFLRLKSTHFRHVLIGNLAIAGNRRCTSLYSRRKHGS